MSLIHAEQDDPAVLAAEDAAIAEAQKPLPPETVDDIALLIERLMNGPSSEEPPLHEG